MPLLSLRSFQQTIQASAAAAQAAASQLLDLTVGSPLRAILEADASVALWMQWLILRVLQATRLSTSSGPDVDTFVQDFSLARLPAVAAVGQVTFSRYVTNGTALVPVGATVTTTDLTESFSVIADQQNGAYASAQNGYPLSAGQASVTATVQAITLGSGGNVGAGAISLISSSIQGVDTATNAAAFASGVDAETDQALKVRFQNYIASLSRATMAAVAYAVSQVQGGLTWFIAENSPSTGTFTVTVDDGSGAPPQALLDAIYAAVDKVRPVGSTFTVQPPVVTVVTVDATITAAAGFQKPQMLGPIVAAVTDYIDALPIGTTVSYSRIISVIYAAVTGLSNVTAVTLNGGTTDIAIGPGGVAKAGVVTIS